MPGMLRSLDSDPPSHLQHLLSEVDNNKVSSAARACKHSLVRLNEGSLQKASPLVATANWPLCGPGRGEEFQPVGVAAAAV